MLSDREHQYGTVSRLFHWASAILVIWQFAKFFDRLNDGEHWIGENIASFHISVGAIFLLIVIARLIWATSQINRRPVNPQSTSLLSSLGHIALYLVMVAIPLLGISFMVGNGYGLKVFGWQLVERGQKIPLLVDLGSLHSPLAWVLLALVIGHVSMAIKHHFAGDKKLIKSML